MLLIKIIMIWLVVSAVLLIVNMILTRRCGNCREYDCYGSICQRSLDTVKRTRMACINHDPDDNR